MTFEVPAMPVPHVVVAAAAGRPVVPVWRNELGGVTYRLGSGAGARYLKWQPPNPEVTLRREAERLSWAGRFITVPEVLDFGVDAGVEWLLTRGIDADSAVSPRWIGEPEVVVPAVGAGLRLLHDRLPVARCPWRWDVSARIAAARERGVTVPSALAVSPSVDRWVVCHGDACCPNTLVARDGAVAGHVDFGSMGTGDRWADIAVAAMSTEWNYGPGWAGTLVEAYGVELDEARMAYYQQLWNAT